MTGRQYLTDRQRREILEAQGGICCVPGCESVGPFEDEHSTPNYFAPGKPDQLMCIPHHKEKTRRDKRAIAKSKRIEGKTRSQWNGDKPARAWPSRLMRRKSARTRDEIMGSR